MDRDIELIKMLFGFYGVNYRYEMKVRVSLNRLILFPKASSTYVCNFKPKQTYNFEEETGR